MYRFSFCTGFPFFISSVICLLCGFLACTPPQKITPAAPQLPEGQALVQTVAPLPSFINVPVKMRTRVVEEMLNAQLAGTLFECDTLTLGSVKGVKIKVSKGDSIADMMNVSV